jgi:Chromo (CHRromatin Organisation MOdifier) domain
MEDENGGEDIGDSSSNAAQSPGEPSGGEFPVEKILDEQIDPADGQLKYKIRWQNYGPGDDSWEPADNIEHCVEIVDAWEATKAARQPQGGKFQFLGKDLGSERKRSRSTKSGEESDDRSKKRPKVSRPSKKAKAKPRVNDNDDSESDMSRITDDSMMEMLKQKNDLTFPFEKEDVRRGGSQSISEEDEDDIVSFKERERQRRKEKRKSSGSSTKPKATEKSVPAKSVPAKSVPAKTPAAGRAVRSNVKGPTTNARTPQDVPHLPYGTRNLAILKPAKRAPGETVPSTIRSDDRRTKMPLTLAGRNNIKKKQRQEPAPDMGEIAMFNPASVLTPGGRTMKSGRGVEGAIGSIDKVIAQRTIEPRRPLERKEPRAESPRKQSTTQAGLDLSARRPSVADAINNAEKIQEGAARRPREPARDISPIRSPNRSPIRSPIIEEPELSPEINTSILKDAWLKGIPASRPSPQKPRGRGFQRDTAPNRSNTDAFRPPASHRRNTSDNQPMSPDFPMTESFHPPSMEVPPIVAQDASRTWDGELLYGRGTKSLGTIRLSVPQSSIRLETIPLFSGPSLSLTKMISTRYLTTKMFLAKPQSSAKPECLLVDFTETDSQTKLVDIFRKMDCAGVVLEEFCTLVFYFRLDDRLRNLFNGGGSTAPISVAVLPPFNIANIASANRTGAEVCISKLF